MDDATFNRIVEVLRAQAIELLDRITPDEPEKDCGKSIDCTDCEEQSDCTLKWEYGWECDADCRNCNNDDCRDR